jgi:peptidoglycan/LPS O-acetylase OafA/YrhL
MNDQSPINEPEPFDRREARRQRRAERLGDPSQRSTWVAGLILILLGGMFLMQNMGSNIPLKNWWALFILIPAIGAIDTGIRMYRQADNRLTAPASGSLLVGGVLTLVTLGFLFNISWTFFGPAILILAGIGVLANAMLGNRQ